MIMFNGIILLKVEGVRGLRVEGLDIGGSEVDKSLDIVHAMVVSYMKIYDPLSFLRIRDVPISRQPQIHVANLHSKPIHLDTECIDHIGKPNFGD